MQDSSALVFLIRLVVGAVLGVSITVIIWALWVLLPEGLKRRRNHWRHVRRSPASRFYVPRGRL